MTKRRGDGEHQTQQNNNLDDLHEKASDGEGFNCGKCACYLAELATEHNHNVRIAELKENIPELADKDSTSPETPSRKVKKDEPAL